MNAGGRILSRMLALYPRAWRGEFRDEMQEVLMDGMMESSSLGFAAVGRFVREARGLAVGAVREWVRRGGPRAPLPGRLPLRGAIGYGVALLALNLWSYAYYSVSPAFLRSASLQWIEACAMCVLAGLVTAAALGLLRLRSGFRRAIWPPAAFAIAWALGGLVSMVFGTLAEDHVLSALRRGAGSLALSSASRIVLSFAVYTCISALQGFGIGAGLGAASSRPRAMLRLGAWGALALAFGSILSNTSLGLLELVRPVSFRELSLIMFGASSVRGFVEGAILGWALSKTVRRAKPA